MKDHEPEYQQNQAVRGDALVLPLTALGRTQLPVAGGKAAQLGELPRKSWR